MAARVLQLPVQPIQLLLKPAELSLLGMKLLFGLGFDSLPFLFFARQKFELRLQLGNNLLELFVFVRILARSFGIAPGLLHPLEVSRHPLAT